MTDARTAIDADIALVARCACVPRILDAVVDLTGLRFAAVARVTDTHWTACAVRDDLGFGLAPGGDLVLETTICNEIRQHRDPVVFGHASEHPVFRDHHTPKQYGLESYISVPIFRQDGAFFGTLCAIDSQPSDIDADPVKVKTLSLFAELIGTQLDLLDDLAQTGARLRDSEHQGAEREQLVVATEREIRDLIQPIVTGLYLLRTSEALDTSDRDVLAHMEACCADIGTMLRERLNQTYDRFKIATGEDGA
jgi:GAF domain-containing protein